MRRLFVCLSIVGLCVSVGLADGRTLQTVEAAKGTVPTKIAKLAPDGTVSEWVAYAPRGDCDHVLVFDCFEATRDHRMMAAPQRVLAAELHSAFQRRARQAEIAVRKMGFGLSLECFDLIGVDLERALEEPTARIAIVQTAGGLSTEQRNFELDVGLERI